MDVKFHFFKSIGSTQDKARELLSANEPVPFLVMAQEQTAGKGRLGRVWISPRGNFFGSLGMKPSVPPARYGEYGFLTAVAILHTLMETSDHDFALKWPNDVLLDGRKCCGILIESFGLQNEYLIIGIGVNLRHAPPDDAVNVPAAAIWPNKKGEGRGEIEEFGKHFWSSFAKWHGIYEAKGFDAIRTEWLAFAHHLNQNIRVKTPTAAHEGIFQGIDAHGNLLLTTGEGTLKVTTADVSFI